MSGKKLCRSWSPPSIPAHRSHTNLLSVVRQSPSYWRIVISNPPLNLFDPRMFAELNVLMDDIERDNDLKVVVFESGDDNFWQSWQVACVKECTLEARSTLLCTLPHNHRHRIESRAGII